MRQAGWRVDQGKLVDASGAQMKIRFLISNAGVAQKRVLEPLLKNFAVLGVDAEIEAWNDALTDSDLWTELSPQFTQVFDRIGEMKLLQANLMEKRKIDYRTKRFLWLSDTKRQSRVLSGIISRSSRRVFLFTYR